jgi:hypothetical protein
MYNTKKELQIDLFFDHVNWYKLLTDWHVHATGPEMTVTVASLNNNINLIKKTWKQNPELTLPQILTSLFLLPLKYIRKGNSNTNWYFSTFEDLMHTLQVDEKHYMIYLDDKRTFLGFKLKPKYRIIK